MPQSPTYRFKRWLDPRPFRTAICSTGGVGSTALARHLLSLADKTQLEHAWSPVVYDRQQNLRLGYMYGCPYNAVLSIFRRNYQHMHSRAMNTGSPTIGAPLKGVGIDEYLERGVDEFRIGRQFENWTQAANTRHPTILIKYESLLENVGPVLEFFECRKPFQVCSRKSQWADQPPHIRRGLERMYGALKETILAMPSIVILRGSEPSAVDSADFVSMKR